MWFRPYLLSQTVLNPAGPKRMENRHHIRAEEGRKIRWEAIDITEQKTRMSTITATVGYARLG